MMLLLCWILLYVCIIANCSANNVTDKLEQYANDYKFGMFPGTKWCGGGHVAVGDELGSLPVTDACCRAHDKCTPMVEGYGFYKGIFNWCSYTRLHCDCDTVFYDCLKKAEANETEAETVGIVYFDVLDANCFKEVDKKICTSWGWFSCSKYEMKKEVAFVDTPMYQTWLILH